MFSKASRHLATATLVAGLGVIGATAALSESHVDRAVAAAIEARQAHMTLYAHNLGLLGGMARGNIDYDATVASAAAANLAALASMDQSRYWPAGSDSFEIEGTRALPAIWDNIDDVMAKSMALTEASAKMETAAGEGLEALQAAIGAVGGACGGCHEDYREPDE